VRELVGLLREGARGGVAPNLSEYPLSGLPPLPSDYVETIVEMGSGFYFDDKLSVLQPRVVCQEIRQNQDDLERIHESEGVYFRDGKLVHHWEISPGDDYVRFSDLICWALENSGKKIFWDSSGNPDHWQVIATDCSVSWVRHEVPFSEYLYGIISRELFCPVFTRPSWPRGTVSGLELHGIVR
jgi:hypothetical protein